MKTMSAPFAAHLAGDVSSLATCWKIIRTDGVRYHFTDHDQDIIFDGDLYKAQAGYERSAINSDSSMSVDNLDVSGVFDSQDIREEDLRAGLFDGAEVFVFLVNWADLSMGQIALRRGWFGEVTLKENGVFLTELRGMTQALSKTIGGLFTPECRTDLGDTKCKVDLEPPEILRDTAYSVGDLVRVRTSGEQVTFALPVINGDFEADGLQDASTFTPTGWSRLSGQWDTHDASNGALPLYSGSVYLEGGSTATGEVTQTVDLVPTIIGAKIDALAYELDVSIARGNSYDSDMGRVIVELLDASDQFVSTVMDTGFEVILPTGSWELRQALAVTIPATARKVKISLLHQRGAGTQSNAAFDALSIVARDMTEGLSSSADFEDRIYRCVSAGTTASTQPVYNVTVGAETLDGSATFEAEEAWFRAGEVLSLSDAREMVVSLTDPRADSSWFAGGLLVWESGSNKGRASEVKSFDPVSGALSFFIPQPFMPEVGERFRMAPGCDKRFATCRDKFANVLNFRGEPYLPGQDELMRYPDAK